MNSQVNDWRLVSLHNSYRLSCDVWIPQTYCMIHSTSADYVKSMTIVKTLHALNKETISQHIVERTYKLFNPNTVTQGGHTSHVAQQIGAYPGFYIIKRLRVFLLPPGWDASPSQGYPSIKFAAIHLCTLAYPAMEFIWSLNHSCKNLTSQHTKAFNRLMLQALTFHSLEVPFPITLTLTVLHPTDFALKPPFSQ